MSIDKETMRQILHDNMQMTKVSAKVVSKLLTSNQKEKLQEICADSLKQIEENPKFLDSVITCDETWVFQYDSDTKRQSMHRKTANSPQIKKARQSKSKFKAMLIVFVLS